MRNKGVVILASFYDAIKPLADADRLQLYDAICNYGIDGKPPDLPPHLQGYFLLIKPNIDSSQNRYRQAVENGGKGGAPKGNQNASKNKQPDIQPENNQTNNHDIEKEKEIEKEIDSEREKYTEGDSKGERVKTAEMHLEDRKTEMLKLLEESMQNV